MVYLLSVFPTENPSMMKNTQDQNSKYFGRKKNGQPWVFFLSFFATKCDTAVGYIKRKKTKKNCLRYSGTDHQIFGRRWCHIQIIDRWCFVVGDISLCRRCISDSVRFNLQCSAAESNKPLPETNRACHIWLSVRLLLFHMCSGASFRASQIIIRLFPSLPFPFPLPLLMHLSLFDFHSPLFLFTRAILMQAFGPCGQV